MMMHNYSKAIIRKPAPNFRDGLTESNLGMPDYELALAQHGHYCQALQVCGLEIIELEPEPSFPDACFVEDAAIIVDDQAVVSRLGHPSRRGEETSIADILASYKQLTFIKEPGTIDGGDVMQVGDHFFIGLTKRTNEEGAGRLADILRNCGKTSSTVRVENFIHLKTFVTSIDADTLVGLTKHMSPG